MDSYNWTCPYCDHAQIVIEPKQQTGEILFAGDENTEFGKFVLKATAIICSNNICKRVTLKARLEKITNETFSPKVGMLRQYIYQKHWDLLPVSLAKPQPNCVPAVIQEDYYEACSIKTLSPKASATLARRCLQGMIRDFCGISKGILFAEINELRRQVDAHEADPNIAPDTVDAIDAVRKIGNIGAHMEKDIDLIIEVDENEVEVLINLIEALFKEWYVARETRQKRLAEITAIAKDKDDQKNKNKDGAAKEAEPES